MKTLVIHLIFTTMLFTGCKDDSTKWTTFKKYSYSNNEEVNIFLKGTAKQTYFTADAPYPNKDVITFYKSNIKKPWILCESSNKWMSFGDASGKKPLFIHQILHHWINKNNSRLLLLAIKYKSKGIEPRAKPDNIMQEVYLVEYKYNSKNLHEVISMLDLNCNGA